MSLKVYRIEGKIKHIRNQQVVIVDLQFIYKKKKLWRIVLKNNAARQATLQGGPMYMYTGNKVTETKIKIFCVI